MKKLILAAVIIMTSCLVFSQKEQLPTLDDLKHFKTTKTYVVLEDNPFSEFNFEVKDVMEKVWTATEFEFIKMSEFPKKSQDSNASFIYTTLVSFEKDKTDSRYVFIHLSLGGENLGIDDLLDIVSVPLGYFGVDQDRYIYKTGVLLQFMQNHVDLMTNYPKLLSTNVSKHYNDNISNAHEKTPYVLEDELAKEVSTAARIKQIYP